MRCVFLLLVTLCVSCVETELIDELRETIEDLEWEVDEKQGEINELESLVEELRDEVDDLEYKISEQEEIIWEYEDEINRQAYYIQQLEWELNYY